MARLPAHRIVRRGIAMVPEGRRLFPSLSVEENLRLGGYAVRPGPWTLDRVYGLFPVLRERRASPPTALGVDVGRLKLAVYVAVAGVTGVVGALIFLQNLRISPEAAFSVADWTANVVFITVIGGIGTLAGPFVGTFVFFLFRHFFAGFGAWYMISLGALAAAVMLVAPGGICGALARRGVVLLLTERRLGVRAAAGPETPTDQTERALCAPGSPTSAAGNERV